MRALGLVDERAEVAAAHVGLHDDAALAVLAADLVRPGRSTSKRATAPSGTKAGGAVAPASAAQRRVRRRRAAGWADASSARRCRRAAPRAGARRGRSAGRPRRPARPRLPPTAICDDVLHVGDDRGRSGRSPRGRSSMVSTGSPVTCSTLHVRGAGERCAGPRRSRSRGRAELVDVVAEDLDRDVAAHAGDQLVEAHLDRLGELVVVAGHALNDLLELRAPARPSACAGSATRRAASG